LSPFRKEVDPIVGAKVITKVAFVFKFAIGVVFHSLTVLVAFFKFSYVAFAGWINEHPPAIFTIARHAAYVAVLGLADVFNATGDLFTDVTGYRLVRPDDTGLGAIATAGFVVERFLGYMLPLLTSPYE
jgi:hypothetical protein